MQRPDSVDLAVDRTSEVPLGTQLIWKLRTLIATGQLHPRDKLPGIREVAESAGVNVNTVRSVFARLEDQGLLSSEHGRGTFVARDVKPASVLAQMADAALTQARAAGIDPRELAAALYVTLPEGAPQAEGGEPPAADERALRRALRAEIAALERELATLDPLGRIDTSPPRAGQDREAAPRILTAAELTKARDELAHRVQQLRRERDQWRAEAQELEELERLEREEERAVERASGQRPSRWREGGIWTGPSHTRVSWTSP